MMGVKAALILVMLVGRSCGQGTPASQTQAASGTQQARGDGSSGPVVVSTANPQYTKEARAEKVSGSVLVHLVVAEDGLPINVKVVRGIGYGLDEKAVEAVKQYRFKPAMKNGQPVKTAINIEVNFQVF